MFSLNRLNGIGDFQKPIIMGFLAKELTLSSLVSLPGFYFFMLARYARQPFNLR
jgi:hypothetical protein